MLPLAQLLALLSDLALALLLSVHPDSHSGLSDMSPQADVHVANILTVVVFRQVVLLLRLILIV